MSYDGPAYDPLAEGWEFRVEATEHLLREQAHHFLNQSVVFEACGFPRAAEVCVELGEGNPAGEPPDWARCRRLVHEMDDAERHDLQRQLVHLSGMMADDDEMEAGAVVMGIFDAITERYGTLPELQDGYAA